MLLQVLIATQDYFDSSEYSAGLQIQEYDLGLLLTQVVYVVLSMLLHISAVRSTGCSLARLPSSYAKL